MLDFADKFVKEFFSTKYNGSLAECFKQVFINSVFCCPQHIYWGYHFGSKIIINIYYNNKQKAITDIVGKDAIKDFKKR